MGGTGIKGMENADAHGLKKETGGWETESR